MPVSTNDIKTIKQAFATIFPEAEVKESQCDNNERGYGIWCRVKHINTDQWSQLRGLSVSVSAGFYINHDPEAMSLTFF